MAKQALLKEEVCTVIDDKGEKIINIGETIMDSAELGYKETETADRVKEIFQEASLPFQDGLAITGIKAILKGAKPGPTIALMGELDALFLPGHPRANPKTGAAHACGHNAQIAGLMGAALGFSGTQVIKELSGNIVFFAVPAEEYVEIEYRMGLVKTGKVSFLTGKQELIKLGCFDDIDIAIMIHSSSAESAAGKVGVSASTNGFLAKSITFIGKAAHSGVAPEEGINALNAATLALSAINAQRDTFRDEDSVRVHPIITKGGELVNIVPSEVKMETYVRGRTAKAILDASKKVDRAIRGAAIAIGCQVNIETVPGNMPLQNDSKLCTLFEKNAEKLFGADSFKNYPHGAGSTDAGDLSQIIPVLHPYMTGASGYNHSREWHIADPVAGYLSPAKTLAMMAIDLLSNDAKAARQIIKDYQPAMSKQEYVEMQQSVFNTELFDGSKGRY